MTSPEHDGVHESQPLSAADVFDAAWEEKVRSAMASTGWNADLAIQAARGALDVLAGGLTEDEFQSRLHDAYLREFGVDLRPRTEEEMEAAALELDTAAGAVALPVVDSRAAAAGEAPVAVTARGASAHPTVSRRTAIAVAGGGIAALMVGDLLGARARQAEAQTPGHGSGHAPTGPTNGAGNGAANGKHKVQMGMVIDLERCDGCLMCVSACKKAYGLQDGVHWLYVLAYKEPDKPNNVNLLVRPCQHCSNAPCVKVCPTGARHRRSDGIVLTNYDVCFGCRYCQVSCPYGVNYFGWEDPKDAGGGFTGERKDGRGKSVIGAPPRGVMGKCIYCPGRQDSIHQEPSTHCSVSCPMGVIHYGDLNDPESEPNRYLNKRVADSGGKLSTFRLLDDLGTRPNVIYIGHRPSRRAEPTANPVKYEDWGLVNERRTVLEGPEPWFKRMFGR